MARATRERYEPEVERHGGPWGVALAEELFHRQSETALALLGKIEPGTRPQRLGKGLLAWRTVPWHLLLGALHKNADVPPTGLAMARRPVETPQAGCTPLPGCTAAGAAFIL